MVSVRLYERFQLTRPYLVAEYIRIVQLCFVNCMTCRHGNTDVP